MGEWADFWKQMDGIKDEYNRTKERVNRVSGWRFKTRKPNGDWRARRSAKRDLATGLVIAPAIELQEPTSAQLLSALVRTEGRCPKCFHKLGLCGVDGCQAPDRGAAKVIVGEKNSGEPIQKHPRCGCTEHVSTEQAAAS